MKLAEALIVRKDLGARLGQLTALFNSAAFVINGETPEFCAADILREVEEKYAALEALNVKINQVNNATEVPGMGLNLMQAIAKRDLLKARHATLSAMVGQLSVRNRRYEFDRETKVTLAEGISIKEMQATVDAVAREHRTLDVAIQAVGWTTEVPE